MNILLGIFFHTLGGFASGSFYMPYNKVKGWAWESYWIVGGLFSWLIIPPIIAYLTIPDFVLIIDKSSSSILAITFFMGLLWGIGGLTYGLGVRYLGMSLGNSVILGFCAAFGAILPTVYYSIFPHSGKITFSEMISSNGGKIVLLGVLVCLIGIAFSGKAGLMKENELTKEQQIKSIAEFNLVKGLIIAVFSGILSSFFNFGIEVGKPLAENANQMWKFLHPNQGEFIFQNNVVFIVILWGGLTTNLIWTTVLSLRNKSFKNFTDKSTPILKNILFSAAAGTIWFMQYFFYGMGESKLGNGASSWILHMSIIILTANFWGIYRKEWKDVSIKTKRTFHIGIVFIISAVIIVGIGNYL